MTQADYLVWYQRETSVHRGEMAETAYKYVVNIMLNLLEHQEIPYQFIYDPVGDTTNIVLPQSIATQWQDFLESAGFIERPMPKKDVEASRDLMKAMINGANLQKKWH